MFSVIKDFLLLFYRDKTARSFALATTLGLAFSLSIILATLGLMDGFVNKLQGALNEGHGEIVLTSTKGFFSEESKELSELSSFPIKAISYQVRTQAFAIKNELGRAAIVLGIDKKFKEINPDMTPPNQGEVILGEGLAKFLKVAAGDLVSLTFAAGRSGDTFLPATTEVRIKNTVKMKIHEYNERFLFAHKLDIQEHLGLENLVNIAKIKLKEGYTSKVGIEKVLEQLTSVFYMDFSFLPFWSEFGYFIKAVDFEKYMISIVLSVVVIIAAFNCLAFIIYSKEKKTQEIFLLYAIGLSPRRFRNLWLIQNFLIWLISICIALLLVQVFGYAIANLEIFALPSDVYHLGRIEINLQLIDFLIVSGLSCIFLMFLTYLVLKRLNARSLASGLRQEF